MNGGYKAGFTLIETILFLAVTSGLIVGILGTSGASISIQRYRDSVTTLESNVQNLYLNTTDVYNDRADGASCGISGAAAAPVGQSDCVVLGKYMKISDDTITTSTVIGYSATQIPDPSQSDLTTIQSYALALIPTSTTTTTLEWGASISNPTYVGILVLRSPLSGLTYTFTTTDSAKSLAGIVNTGVTAQRSVCVKSATIFTGGLAVVVNPGASGSDDIQIRSSTTPLSGDGVVNPSC